MEYKLSLYDPITIQYGELKLKLRKLNRSMYRKLKDFSAAERGAADKFAMIEIVYDELKAFVDCDPELIDDLDDVQVEELKEIIDAVVFKRKAPAAAEDAEKNGSRPGDEAVA